MSDVKKCDRCGFEIESNEQFTVINGSATYDYCCEECLGEALTQFLLTNDRLHLDKTDERTFVM